MELPLLPAECQHRQTVVGTAASGQVEPARGRTLKDLEPFPLPMPFERKAVAAGTAALGMPVAGTVYQTAAQERSHLEQNLGRKVDKLEPAGAVEQPSLARSGLNRLVVDLVQELPLAAAADLA